MSRQRVGRGDLAVDERVVDDRREEIDGLHERRPALPPVHTRIVRGPEVDQDPRVGLRWKVAQHLSELASGEFARSTGAGDQLGQALLAHGLLDPAAALESAAGQRFVDPNQFLLR